MNGDIKRMLDARGPDNASVPHTAREAYAVTALNLGELLPYTLSGESEAPRFGRVNSPS